MLADRGVQPVRGAHEDLDSGPQDVLAVPHIDKAPVPLFDDHPLLGQAPQHLAHASRADVTDQVSTC